MAYKVSEWIELARRAVTELTRIRELLEQQAKSDA